MHSLLVSNYISNCSLVKKAILKDAYYDEKLSGKKLEDYDFFLNLIINNGAKAVYQPNTKLNYRVFETGSVSGRDSVRYHYEIYLEILRSILISYHIAVSETDDFGACLDDLLKHHEDVTEYVNRLKRTINLNEGRYTN
ncbi:MAG: hypothetical protein ACLROH_07605 [Streptococcus sp.]